MADKHFVDEIGTVFEVDCGDDISSSSVHTLKVRKPSGAEVTWSGSVYNSNFIRYTAADGDLDEAGTYRLQSYIEIGTWKGRGLTALFTIFDEFAYYKRTCQ